MPKHIQLSPKINVKDLFRSGNGHELKTYTHRIQHIPVSVIEFERAFDDYFSIEDSNGWDEPQWLIDFQWVFDTLHKSFEQFLSEMPASRDLGHFLVFTNHGSDVTIEFGWNDAKVGNVLWDRWLGSVEDPILAFASIGHFFNKKSYLFKEKTKEIKEPPMYRYHPERFYFYHPCADKIGKIFRHKVLNSSGMLTIDVLNEIMDAVAHDMFQLGVTYPRKLKFDTPSQSHVIESMESLATAYGRFVQAGRQIMDFPPALTEMLAKTDVDEIPLESIKMPYASQYLYFGPQENLELDPGWFVDGAYVESRGAPGDLRFTVTACPVEHTLSQTWFVHPEPQYTQDFVENFRSMDLSTAMDKVFCENISSLKERIDSSAITFENQIIASTDGAEIIDVSSERAKERIISTNYRYPVYREALKLVVNALCYITAYPEDIGTIWPEGTPSSLKTKADTGIGKESSRAKSKLASMGYVPVHICGKRIEDQRTKISSPTGTHPSAHWRRGHWRNQPYGQGRSLRKIIWMMPVLVVANNQKGEPDTGHLYLVS